MNLLNLANTEAGRYLLSKLGQKPEYPIVKINHNSFIERLDKKTFRGTFFSRRPIEELFAPILEKINIANEEYKPISDTYEAFLFYSGLQHSNKYPQIFLNSSTFNPAAGANSPVNGNVLRNSAASSWADLINGAGTAANVDPTSGYTDRTLCSATISTWDECVRGIFLFDTSPLGAGATISAATFSQYNVTKSDPFAQAQSHVLCSSSPAANNTLAASDYNVANFGSTDFGRIAFSTITSAQYNDITLNASGITNISLTGISKFGVRISADFDASSTSWVSTNEASTTDQFAGQTNKPKLVVTFKPGSTGSFLFNFI